MVSSASGRTSWTRGLGAWTGVLLSLLCLCLCVAGAGPAGAAGGEDAERVGKLTVEIGWDASRQEVEIRERCVYTLAPGSEALGELREEGFGLCDGYTLLQDGEIPETHGWETSTDEVTQESPRSPARVETEEVYYLLRRSGPQELNIAVDMASMLSPAAEGTPKVWTVEVRAPRWSFSEIRGPVESQSSSGVTWRVAFSPLDEPRVTHSLLLRRTVETTKLPMVRRQTWGEVVTAFGLAVCGIGVVAALLVARLVGPDMRRRWVTATLAPAAAAYSLAFFGVPMPLWLSDLMTLPWDVGTRPEPPPNGIWSPPPVLGLWLWYVLPVAGWWFSRRLVTRRPPSHRVLVVSGAAPLLVLPLMAADGVEPSPAMWPILAGSGAVALAVTLLLRRRGGGRGPAHRWSATAGTLLWITAVLYWLGHAPAMFADSERAVDRGATAMLICTWPFAAWITSLLGPALGRTVRPVVLGSCFVALWALLLSPFLVAHTVEPTARGFDPWDDYRSPFFTGYAGFPFCVVVVCGVILQLVYLARRGGLGDRGRAVEPVGRVLLVCGVLTALGVPSMRTLPVWGIALAVFCAALGSRLPIPLGSDAKTAKFRRVGREAHARFLDRWVRTQLLWDTRADCQRAARSALAEDMPVSDFSGRWEELAVPGRHGDPATRLARAKRFALGSSAGVAPWRAGLAGAGLAQLLALPWALYKLTTAEPVGADGFMPFHLQEISKALRFAHWTLYGFVYGYFYALLRGHTPVAKAAVLMAVVLPAEVLAMAPLTLDPQYTVNPSWKDMAVACGGLAGQTLVVCMGLGLAWEWWLARAAALKWSQVRNFRRLSSITVPLGTALVAAATAFATVVAGAWAQQELQPPSGSPSSAPIAPPQPGQPAR